MKSPLATYEKNFAPTAVYFVQHCMEKTCACHILENLIRLFLPAFARLAAMTAAVVAAFEITLISPLDVWQGQSGRKAARNRTMTVVGVECQADIGKVLARSSTLIQVDVKESGDVQTIHTALLSLGRVSMVNRELLQERLEVDRAFKAQRVREGNGLLTGSEVVSVALPALMKLWGDAGTAAQNARRGDVVLEMMQTGQKAAAASQSDRLASVSLHGANDVEDA